MQIQDIMIKDDNTRELTPERQKAFKEYLRLNKYFKSLREQGICTHILIKKIQFERDPSKVTKDTTEEELKDLPLVEQEYMKFLLLPYTILESDGQERCIDNYDTEIIELINERIKIKVNTYKEFLKLK